MISKKVKDQGQEIFGQIKSSFLDYDPAHFIQNNLTLDGETFTVLDNGWKFMADIYRYIALQATKKDGKPVVICKGRQVGATVMGGALDLYFTNSKIFSSPPIRVAHLFPTLGQSKRFSQDKLEGLIRDAKNDVINKNKLQSQNAVDNQTLKQFCGGSLLWIESLGADADRIRGMTLDVALFDEIQDMPGFAIGNCTKTLTAAKYGPVGKGVQVFFGTPKEKGSYFENIWEMSDKRYYHLGCGNCKETFPFYQTNDESWKTIWPSGYNIVCPICGAITKKIDAINAGKWVASKNSDECQFVGFHINQLYIPNLTREHINDLMPANNPNQIERVWNNEVIGEFYAGVGMPLTRQHIETFCKDTDRAFSTKIDGRFKNTYFGADWGDKIDTDSIGQSFSCVVILSDLGDGTLLVEHAHKLRERSLSYKKETVNEMYRRFGIKQGVCDFFFGQEVVRDLQQIYNDRLLGAQGSGNLTNPLKYREDELMISYNKDLMIDEIFDKIRRGKIRFPWRSYEYIEWLIDHCTSMGTSITSKSGQQVKTYVKGSTPNDGLMALLYAYMAWKFDVTERFTIKAGRKEDTQRPRPTLAYFPKLR